jgi:hypothetical protein
MIIVGCDYHPSFQQIACVDTETGEWNEQRLGWPPYELRQILVPLPLVSLGPPPELVAGGHRPVRDRLCPVRFSGRLKRNRALHITKSGHLARRIILILRRRSR